MPKTGEGQEKGLYCKSTPVYERYGENNQRQQLAQDHLGRWWFRDTHIEHVWIAGQKRDVLKWGQWGLATPQPDPNVTPGRRSRRVPRKYALLPCGPLPGRNSRRGRRS